MIIKVLYAFYQYFANNYRHHQTKLKIFIISFAAIILEFSLDKYPSFVSCRSSCMIHRSRSESIRTCMSHHYTIQRSLFHFNTSFSSFLIIFLVQIFIMCVALFFSIIKIGSRGAMDVVLFFGNGFQYLVRGTLVLYGLADVAGKPAQDVKPAY